MAPANTGKDNNNSTAVITTAHTNNGIRSNVMPCGRMLITVVIKFTAPRIDEIPARCSLKIAKSTDAPPWALEGPRHENRLVSGSLNVPYYFFAVGKYPTRCES
jgi:hypothetical protein